MPKRADEILFISECPILDCDNKDIITWHHCGCPINIPLYISTKGVVRCDYCNLEDLYVNCKFNCGCHEGETYSAKFHSSTKLKKILYSIGLLADKGIISTDFAFLLGKALIEQVRKSKFNNGY